MATETEKVIIETEVKLGNSGASIKSVKTELRNLQNELANLEPGSKAFTIAAQRAGQLKDKIQDTQATISAFHPEAKFQAFAAVVGGVANGFAAAQGAMALFGSENEGLTKLMVKTQGAIALATGLNGLMGMKDAFTNLKLTSIATFTSIRAGAVAAFSTLKGALISTGIGAFVVGLGLVIQYFYEMASAEKEATKELERYNEVKDELDKKTRLNIAKELGDRQLAKTKLLEAFREEREGYQKRLDEGKINQAEYNEFVKQASIDLNFETNKLQAQWDKEDADKAKVKLEKKRQEAEKLAEIDKWEDEQIREGNEQIEKERIERIEKAKSDAEEFAEFIKQIDDQTNADKKANVLAQIELEKQLEKNRIDALNTTANALSGFAQLAGQQTAIGKALGIATTTIDTYVAAQAAFKSGSAINPALGYVAAAGAIAAGFARVRAIMAVQIPNTSMASSMPSMPSTNAAPIVRPSSSTVNIGNTQPIRTSNQNNQDGRVYVLESDITSTQEKVENIRKKTIIK